MTTDWRPTRYAEFGYRQDADRIWRVIDAETGAAIGPYYRTKVELLVDLDGFARGRLGSQHDG